jgi:hypothetical protein
MEDLKMMIRVLGFAHLVVGYNQDPFSSTAQIGRRNVCSSGLFLGLVGCSTRKPASAAAPLVVGSDCERGECLGVVNGLLTDCDSLACVSSQDDATGGGSCFSEPWEYEYGSLDDNFAALKRAVVDARVGLTAKEDRVDVVSVGSDERYRYLRVRYTLSSGAVDDCEFYMPGIIRVLASS